MGAIFIRQEGSALLLNTDTMLMNTATTAAKCGGERAEAVTGVPLDHICQLY